MLDVPANHILDGSKDGNLSGLADNVERWAHDVATVVDDVNQSFSLALE